MKNQCTRILHRLLSVILLLPVLGTLFSACEDTYHYDDREPDWLGDNIYAFLKDDGRFTNTLRLIDDLEYDDVMKLTGSVTLFAATDSAFDEFFK
ncbi:MAG: fasciclin domain-containing protein, partial [Bacteroidales bacterium]|nr:fasciclin domain-containing protein [Bacteroidales bacterium]